MTDTTVPRRTYDSSRRKAQAAETRMAIGRAALKLFTERGYAGASMEAIAAEAGVARETVYAIFKNKQNLLAYLLDIAVGGDEEPVRLIDRPGPQANLRDTDQRRQVKAFAEFVAEVLSRAAPVFEIMRAAAKTEPAIARRIRRLYQERLENMNMFVAAVAANGPLHANLDVKSGAEMVWGLSSPDLYQLMTQYRGWSQQQFADWLADTLRTLLLA